MLTSILNRKVTRSAMALAAAGLALGSAVAAPHAGADPKQYSAFTVVGSDTVQDIANAFAGESSGNLYTALRATDASKKQLSSWDAIGTACITPKAPGASFDRPNGSGAGITALSRAIDGANLGTAACGGAKPVSGLVDVARSSSGPSGAGTELTYVPFGRDGMSFGYYANGVASPVTSLTSAQLQTLFTTGPQVISGVNIIPCGIQTQSGTYKFWNTALAMTASQEATGTATCNAAGNGVRLQENDGNGLKAKGDAQVGSQVIVGFSAANYISQANGVVTSQLPAPFGTVDLGAIDALGKPYTGASPPLTPSSSFYASGTYGRNIYFVVPTAKFGGLAGANVDYKSMFSNILGTAAICSAAAQTTVNNFGFLSSGSCGSTATTGPLT